MSTLRRLGYHVLQATTGDFAERLLARDDERIDMVLAACQSPEPNGHGLPERLLGQQPQLKLLLVSEQAGVAASETRRNGHALAHLAKPFTATDLAYEVRRLLDGAVRPTGN